jgi:hypothetical protein
MGRRGDELVFRSAQLGASLIHRLGNAVWSLAGQVFFKSVAKKAPAGSIISEVTITYVSLPL